jgi:hypothetical protein
LLSGKGFQTASYVQTASIETIAELFGEVIAAPLFFVLVTLMRNAFYWKQPKASASALGGAFTFALLLGAIAGALTLYSRVVFMSTDLIGGQARSEFVAGTQRSCVQKQRSLGQNVTDAQITTYCSCTAEKMADGTTYRQLGGESPDIANLRQKVEAAVRTCQLEVSK